MKNFENRMAAIADCPIVPERLQTIEKALTLALVELSYLTHGHRDPEVRRCAAQLSGALSQAATGHVPVDGSRWNALRVAVRRAEPKAAPQADMFPPPAEPVDEKSERSKVVILDAIKRGA